MSTTGGSGRCPLCNRPAAIVASQFVDGVACDCCGRFDVDAWVLHSGRTINDAYQISGVTRNATLRGDRILLTMESIDSLPTLAPEEWDVEGKCRILLRHLARMSRYPSQTTSLNLEIDYPLCYAHDADECAFLCEQLRELNWITWSMGSDGRRVTLTHLGWVESQAAERHESAKVFVAMSFDKDLDLAYSEGIEAAVKGAGYLPKRIDREQHNNKIDDEIQAEIKESRFLVADLTGHRNGVYFEAGMAIGLGMPVVWTCRRDDAGNTHFDTRQYNRIQWETPAELREALDLRIRATIGKGPLRPV